MLPSSSPTPAAAQGVVPHMQLGCRSHAARVLPSLLSARQAAWGGMEQRRRSALMAGSERNRCSSPHQKERDRAPEPDVGDLASSCSSTGPPMAFLRRPPASSLASSDGHHSALSPLFACVHSHNSPRLHQRHVQFTLCEVRCSSSMAEEFVKRIVPHSMQVLWSCSSEMLAMPFRACARAVQRAPPLPIGRWTMAVQLGDARHAVQGLCACSRESAISITTPAVRRPW